MLNIDETTKELFDKDSATKELTIYFYKEGNDEPEFIVTNENIVYESMVLNEVLSDDKTIVFGECYASRFEIEIFNTNVDVIGYKIRVDISINGNSLPLFNGIIETCSLKNNRIIRKIIAYDQLYYKFETDVTKWYQGLENAFTTESIRKSLFEYLEIGYIEKHLVNDGFIAFKNPNIEKITAREIIRMICEINGCFGHIDRYNRFVFKELVELNYNYPSQDLFSNTDLYPGVIISEPQVTKIETYIGCDYGEYTTKPITKVEIRDEEDNLLGEFDSYYNYPNERLYPSTTLLPGITEKDINIYTIKGNLLVDGNSFTWIMAANIYNVIAKYTYIPCRVNLKGKPYVEVGDVISLEINSDNRKELTTYVFSRNLTGIQASKDEFETKGEEYHEQRYKI